MTAPRFLVDENLSVELPGLAHGRGYDATHVNHRGLRGWKDWNLLSILETESWVLVTNNVEEFKLRLGQLELHPGAIFVLDPVPRDQQLDLFDRALDEVDINPDLINTAVDVWYEGGATFARRYSLP